MTYQEASQLYSRVKKDLKIAAYVIFAGCMVVNALYATLPAFQDDTDGDRRSGMMSSVDAQTGCHYLRAPAGGITPRMDKEGRHVCD